MRTTSTGMKSALPRRLQSADSSCSLTRVDCYRCGRPVALGPDRRVGFRAECEGCGADLHVCRGCGHHDPGAYNECRESGAERVLDKERANRCDYFAPPEGQGAAAVDPTGEAQQARTELERLFRK